jgi:hypothetical protein
VPQFQHAVVHHRGVLGVACRSMSLAALAGALGAMAFLTSVPEGVGAGGQAGARVVDRTVICVIPVHAGIRDLTVSGNSGVRLLDDRTRWHALPAASLGTGSSAVGVLVRVQAGAPVPDSAVGGTVWIYTTHCRPSRATVAFSARALSGGLANKNAEHFECQVPRRVLIRLKAEFRAPTSLRSRDGGLTTQSPVKRAFLAARTETGRPLAYADVSESGRTRLFYAGNCLRG